MNNCHCTQCQHQTGSTYVVNAFYENERIEVLSGSFAEHVVKAGSGGPHTICRCAECGAAVLSYYPRLGRLGAGPRVGTLDDPSQVRPDTVIFISERMPWVSLPEGIPAFEKTYAFADVLQPERIARMLALAERRKGGEG